MNRDRWLPRSSCRALLSLSLSLLLGCGTRVVDLTPPNPPTLDAGTDQGGTTAAGMPAKCELVKRADGTECKICYAPDGKVLDGSCIPNMAPSPPPVDNAAASCKVAMMADTRCLFCAAPTGEYTVCLKCEAPVKTGVGGEACRTCLWSDQAERCLQCFAADGTTTHDDCDTFRKESFPKTVVPPR